MQQSADILFEIPILDDIRRKNMRLVRMAGGAAELAEVVAVSENQFINHFFVAMDQKVWQFDYEKQFIAKAKRPNFLVPCDIKRYSEIVTCRCGQRPAPL